MRAKSTPPVTIDQSELDRLEDLQVYERKFREKGFRFIAGVDEAGRGPLAGPVVAAACIIPEGVVIPGVNDSKKLKPKKRAEIFNSIVNDPHIYYGVGIVSADEIDRINILQATIQAMLKAVLALGRKPDVLLVDGLKLPHPSIFVEKIIKGDAKSQSIAAASIIAKETRDKLMEDIDLKWPGYGFKNHKGYGTTLHLEALKKLGPCPLHRKTFAPIASLLPFQFK